MFNGIIYNQGKISKISKRPKGINIFVKSNFKLKKKDNIVSFFKTLSEFDRRNIADEDSGGGFTKELIDLDTSNGKKQVEILIGTTIKILENDETGEIKMISGIDVRSLYYNIIDEDGDDDWTRIGLIFYNNDIMEPIEIIEKNII